MKTNCTEVLKELYLELDPREPGYSFTQAKDIAHARGVSVKAVNAAIKGLYSLTHEGKEVFYSFKWDDLKIETLHLSDAGWEYCRLHFGPHPRDWE